MTLATLKNSARGPARAAILLCAALGSGSAFGACATQEPFTPLGGAGGGPAPTAGSGGAAAGAAGSAVANAGHGGDMSSSSGAAMGGAGNGGTGGAATGGGGAMGGSTQAGGGSGGASGSAGSAGAGAGAGGMSAGAGGTSGGASGNAGGGMGGSAAGNGGSAGSGGSGGATVLCADHPIPATTKWTLTASNSSPTWPLANAIDGNTATRWSTGVDQKSDWLQVDFGVATALDTITLMLGTSPTDYPRAYEVRVSNSSQNTTVAALARGNGQQATDTVVSLPTPALGRYLLITQTGSATNIWWSVAELKIGCVH